MKTSENTLNYKYLDKKKLSKGTEDNENKSTGPL